MTHPTINPDIDTTLNTAEAHGRSLTVREVHPHNRLAAKEVKIGHHHGIILWDIPRAMAEPVNPIMNKKDKTAGDMHRFFLLGMLHAIIY
jgi:hypothetical protein